MTLGSFAWIRVNNGLWNGNSGANPATLTGGLDISHNSGSNMLPIAVLNAGATGDQLTANFGSSGFAFTIPAGFTGWPHTGGGFTTFDPSTLNGGSLSGGDLVFNETGSGENLAQGLTVDEQSSGKFYWEFTLNSLASISAHATGGGVGLPGPNPASFACGAGGGAGQFSGGNTFGGASSNAATIGLFGSIVVPSLGSYTSGVTLCIAVGLQTGGTPIGGGQAFFAQIFDAQRQRWAVGNRSFVDFGRRAARQRG